MQSRPTHRILVLGLASVLLAACGGAGGGDDDDGGNDRGNDDSTSNESPSIDSSPFANTPENKTDTGYTATASDPDGDSVSFSLVGGVDQGAFNIDANSGSLTFKSAPDFENPGDSNDDNVYVVEIRASDGNEGTDTLTVSVTVTDVDEGTGNNAPSFTSGASASTPENQTDTGYTAEASDPDGDSVTFGLTGSPDQGAFNIDANSGALTFKSAPDFDSPGDSNGDNDYVVDVTADDGNGGVTEQTVTITVTNVNEDPTFTSGTSASMPENQTDTGYSAAVSDPDGDSISFSLVGGADQAAFSIGTSSGALSFKSAPDFEIPGDSDSNNDYVVDIGASDGNGGSATLTVTVTVTDVAEGGSAGCYTDRAGSALNPSTPTLEFFSGSLRAVDPGNPGATPQTIDSDADTSPAPAPVLDGGWQTGGGITNPAVARVVYQDSANHLYQVSTEIGNANPIRMSGETGAVNRFEVGHDYNNPDNACIAYRLSSSGDWQMTRLGAGSGTVPEDFPGTPVVAFNDNNSGAHDGWLTLDGGELRRIFGDGSVGSGLGGLSGLSDSEVDLIDSLPDGTAFLNIDGDLFAYEPSTDTLTDFGHSFPNNIAIFKAFAPEFAVADDSQLYFTDEYNLYRTELPAGSVETLESFPGDAVQPADPEADRLAVTNTRVIWTYTSDSGVKIRSIVKSTGAASTLDTLPSGTNISTFNDNQTYLARSDQWFFYTALEALTSERTAVALRDDGTNEITYANNRWKGANLNPRPGSDMGDALQQIYLLSGTANAGETLQFVPAGNPSSNTTLGTLPADTRSNADAFQLGGGIGTARLAQVSVGSGGDLETDILFIDTASATLLLATDDNSNNETPVALF